MAAHPLPHDAKPLAVCLVGAHSLLRAAPRTFERRASHAHYGSTPLPHAAKPPAVCLADAHSLLRAVPRGSEPPGLAAPAPKSLINLINLINLILNMIDNASGGGRNFTYHKKRKKAPENLVGSEKGSNFVAG